MVKIISGFQDPSNIDNYHLLPKPKQNIFISSIPFFKNYKIYQILFSRTKALNPLLANIELLSNVINIWFLGLETFVLL